MMSVRDYVENFERKLDDPRYSFLYERIEPMDVNDLFLTDARLEEVAEMGPLGRYYSGAVRLVRSEIDRIDAALEDHLAYLQMELFAAALFWNDVNGRPGNENGSVEEVWTQLDLLTIAFKEFGYFERAGV